MNASRTFFFFCRGEGRGRCGTWPRLTHPERPPKKKEKGKGGRKRRRGRFRTVKQPSGCEPIGDPACRVYMARGKIGKGKEKKGERGGGVTQFTSRLDIQLSRRVLLAIIIYICGEKEKRKEFFFEVSTQPWTTHWGV